MNGQRREQRGRRGRPCSRRRVRFTPGVTYFKPHGVPLSDLDVVEINKEELEALRLKHLAGLDQRECAAKMDTSPSTLQRILTLAERKTALALVKGKAIRIVE